MVIQFICRGNAFRSIIAQAYLNSLKLPGITVLSSGTCARMYKDDNAKNFILTLELLEKHGIKQYAKDHYADNVEQSSLDKSDITICLNEIVYEEANSSFKLPENNHVWDITDVGEADRVATNDAERMLYSEDVYTEIVEEVDSLVESIGMKVVGDTKP